VEVDVLVLLGNDGLQMSILDVGNSEGLQHTRVWVSEVAILNLELMAKGLNLVGDISTSVEGTEYVVCWGGGAEGLSLGDGDGSLKIY
jgi:hypothetical protein